MEVKELETALTRLPGVKYVCTGGNTAQQNLIQEIDKQCGRCSAISRTHCFFYSLFWDRKKLIRVCKPYVCMPRYNWAMSSPSSNFRELKCFPEPSLSTGRILRALRKQLRSGQGWILLSPVNRKARKRGVEPRLIQDVGCTQCRAGKGGL